MRRTPRTGRGFTVTELLVVVAIMVVLAAASMPGLNSALSGSNLNRAGQTVEDLFLQARQEAVSKNREVEVRLYSYAANGATAWRAVQLFRVEQSAGTATLVPLGRIFPLPKGVVISSIATLSPLLDADASLRGAATLPALGAATYAGFRYRPDGSVESAVTTANNFLTLQGEHDAANPPKNYCTLQVNPVTGKVTAYRP